MELLFNYDIMYHLVGVRDRVGEGGTGWGGARVGMGSTINVICVVLSDYKYFESCFGP